MENLAHPGLVELTARIVSAYVSNNAIVASDLPHLINETYAALSRAVGGIPEVEREIAKRTTQIAIFRGCGGVVDRGGFRRAKSFVPNPISFLDNGSI